jgi:hypothetical protein
MRFKEKSFHKKIINDSRITMDAKHNLTIKKIQKEQSNISKLKKKSEKLENDLLTTDEINDKMNILNEINGIKSNIVKLGTKFDEHKYYLDNADLLIKYYNIKSTPSLEPGVNDHNILNFFNMNKDDEDIADVKPDYKKTAVDESDNIDTFNKINIINKYMSQIDDDFVNNNYTDNEIEKCKICNNCMNINIEEGSVICDNCGNTEKILLNTEKPSYKDPPREISYFAYKRINHFNEWLAQFQAKESTEIPDLVYQDILKELKKETHIKMNQINAKKVRDILKKLSLNKYYEHVPHIINMINGKPAPLINRTTEEKLRMMFKEIQTPFLKHCPPDRKNFLSYSYVLHKFVELLDLDEFLPCFPLLKSREKLQQQDMIWCKICKELKWQYIPSI